ncbi:hypothetical protein AB1Y20_023286 [Prymnesium parvum]|uniref:Alpha-galactosidase n=1 Tax=Prymnesium parvum TaxID=97485 RepID=A0AB34JFS2_PRYPA
MRARRQYSAWLPLGATVPLVCGLHNSIYYERPPMGWRSWNVFNADVTQELMQSVMDAAVRQRIGLDGQSISLAELGYVNIGLDDGWQACNAGVRGSFHDATGKPLINTERFPDLRRMTAYGHDKGLRVGFYANNCICGEVGPTGSDDPDAILEHYVEDVRMIVDYGFDGVKVDACGQYLDMRLWARLLNETGRQVLLENCHWGMQLRLPVKAS